MLKTILLEMVEGKYRQHRGQLMAFRVILRSVAEFTENKISAVCVDHKNKEREEVTEICL